MNEDTQDKRGAKLVIIGSGHAGIETSRLLEELKDYKNTVIMTGVIEKTHTDAVFEEFAKSGVFNIYDPYLKYSLRSSVPKETNPIDKLRMNAYQIFKEYELILKKESKLSRSKRDLIVSFCESVIIKNKKHHVRK